MKKIQYKTYGPTKAAQDAFILLEYDGVALIYVPPTGDEDMGLIEFGEKKNKYWHPVENAVVASILIENQGELDNLSQALGEIDFKL